MKMHKANGQTGHDTENGTAFAAFLREHGYEYEQVLAWIKRRDTGSKKEPPTEKPKSADATRKTKQRAEDKKQGWDQCNIKAPDDDEARSLLSEIATGMKDNPEFRTAIRIALKNPEIVMLGATVHALKGFWGLIVRAILRMLKSMPTHRV